MSVEFCYQMSELTSADEITTLYEKMMTGFSDVPLFSDECIHSLYLEDQECCIGVAEMGSMTVDGLSLEGQFTLQEGPANRFKIILDWAIKNLGDSGHIFLDCDFEERQSKQSKRYYDSVGMVLKDGIVSFTYSANGSKVMNDPIYRRPFMEFPRLKSSVIFNFIHTFS